MADFIFETGTQTDAANFDDGDTLYFDTTAPTDVNVTFNAASGFQVATVTLSAGDKELTFAADALGNAEALVFIHAEGELVIGTSAGEALAFDPATTAASAIWGLGGNDTIAVAVEGDHIIHGGAGADTVTVTAPDDSLSAGANGDLIIFGDAGDDTITYVGAVEGDSSIDGGAGVDVINAGSVTDTGNLYLLGGAGADVITGGGGNDHIYGLSTGAVQGVTDGDDSINAGGGHDVVNGNAGDDTINAGDGNDRVAGGQGDDSIFGGLGNDSLQGNLGDDTLYGDAGTDSVRGGQGDDVVYGGDGNDIVAGDIGDDTVLGGAGVDAISGGVGADVFAFDTDDAIAASTSKFDVISDFSLADGDLLNINGFDGEVLYTPGAAFTTVAAALLQAQAILDDADSGDMVSAQVNGDTFLFFQSTFTAGDEVDSYIKLTGVTSSTIDEDAFVVPA